MKPCCRSPQVQGNDEEADEHQPDQADVLPGVHAAQRNLRPFTLPEDQPYLGYQVGVGRDYVEHSEQRGEAEGAHSELAQRLHRFYGEAQFVDEVSRRGDAEDGDPEHQQIEDPRLATEHDGVEGVRRALADTLEVTVADDRLHDQEPEAPEEAEVSHPIVVLPVVLPRGPQISPAGPASDQKSDVGEVPDKAVHVEGYHRLVEEAAGYEIGL